jgi:RNA polymerase subunit RPABC4/transcription elongation factor Spt4
MAGFNWGKKRRMTMKACEKHDNCVVVFSEDTCPLCNTEKALKTIIEKSMGILEEVKRVADEVGLKKKSEGESTL